MRKNVLHILMLVLCAAILAGLAGCGGESVSEESGTAAEVSYGDRAEVSVLSYEEIQQSRDSLYFVGMRFAVDGEENLFDVWLIPDDGNLVVAVGKNEAHAESFAAEDYWGYSLEDAFVMAYETLSQNGDILENQEKLICCITAMSYDREDSFKEIFANAVNRINPAAAIEFCIDSETERIAGCFEWDEECESQTENADEFPAEENDNRLARDFETMTLSEDTVLDAGSIDLSAPLIIDLNGHALKLTGMLQFESEQCRKYDGVLEQYLGDGRYSGIFRVQDSSADASGTLDVSELHFGMADQTQIDEEDIDIDFHTCVALFEINYKNIIGIAAGSEHNETDPYFDLHMDPGGEFMNLIYFHEGYETRTEYWNEYIYEALNNNINVEDYHESLCMHDAEVELNFDLLDLDCESAAFGGPKDYFIYVGKGTTLKLTGTYDYRNVALKIIYLDRFGDGPVTIDASGLSFILHDEYRQTEIIKVDNWYSDAVQEYVTFICPEVIADGTASALMFENGKVALR